MELKEKPRLRLTVTVLLILCIGAALTVLSSDTIHGRWARPKTILVNGSHVVVNDALRLNRFQEGDFSRAENGRMRYLKGKYRTGVDVSVFQGDIDWAQVAADGIDFAFVRAGTRSYATGELRPDQNFVQNIQGAAENGLDVGVYFFSQAITPAEAEEEADFLLQRMAGLPITLPVVFDWEQVSADLDEEQISRTRGAGMETVTACALAFFQRLEQSGYEGMLYCNNDSGYFTFDLAQLQDYPVWFAAYSSDWPGFYYGVDLWQYSESGSVQGISEPVDLDILPIDTDPMDRPTLSLNGEASQNAAEASAAQRDVSAQVAQSAASSAPAEGDAPPTEPDGSTQPEASDTPVDAQSVAPSARKHGPQRGAVTEARRNAQAQKAAKASESPPLSLTAPSPTA